MIKTLPVGAIESELQGVVIFGLDAISHIAEQLGLKPDDLVAQYSGVSVPIMDGHNEFQVYKSGVVQEDGSLRTVVTLGGDLSSIARFLTSDEQTLDEFVKGHPDYCILGEGEFFNDELYAEIVKQYEQTIKVVP